MANQLFTIISLMIGIFGATISVILVIRNVGTQKVKDNDKLALDKIEEMKEKGAVADILDEAGGYRRKINYCGIWFTK